MKVILFCKKAYSFNILRPIQVELEKYNDQVLWYIGTDIITQFPYSKDSNCTTEIQEIIKYEADAIFAPGNEMPYFLRGVKVQIFHGLAGEKKGHFRIRNYFDLYLTPGAYFTNRFNKLAKKHRNFDVIETGWSKLDSLFLQKDDFILEKQELKIKHQVDNIILYAPTFSPSLTSANHLYDEIIRLSKNPRYLVLVKFHDKMNKEIITKYQKAANNSSNLNIVTDSDICKYLTLADLMISDTSSVVYEFLLLDKPVITLRSSSKNIKWTDIKDSKELNKTVDSVIKSDQHQNDRKWIIDNYHPYNDGQSSKRMVNAVKQWISENPIPEQRKLSWYRRWKISKSYSKDIS